MLHELKITPMYFKDAREGNKTFEIRKDDRPYDVGDYLLLREYLGDDEYTGAEILEKVLYIYRGELCLPDHCIMATKKLDSWTVR